MELKKNWRDLLPHKSKLSCRLLGKDLEERNKLFRKMSPTEKNIEVALDCLTMLDMGKIVSQEKRDAKYWSERLKDELTINSLSDKEMKKRQKKALNVSRCDVCQIGATMLSKLRLGEEIKECYGGSIENGYKPGDRVGLGEIEAAYEHRPHLPYIKRTPERMANNFLNLIHNGGKFEDNDHEDYLKDILR